MTDVPVNPTVLAWARTERGLTPELAAKRLGIAVAELAGFESGDQIPNLSFLRNMAEKYEISFAALLMPEPLPPGTRLSVTDFRTHGGEGVLWGPELLAVLDDINAAIDGLADLRNYKPSLFGELSVPLASTKDDPKKLAASERERIGLKVINQLAWRTENAAFNWFREIVEAQGIFVYVIAADRAQNWRGLTILDERQIPLIVINGDEPSPRYRLFSLFHGYAHVMLRLSAISGGHPNDVTERFCNQFAAFFLMPPDTFTSVVREVRQGEGERAPWTDKQIKEVADRFWLSMSSVALHLEDLGFADGLYAAHHHRWHTRARAGAGGDYYRQMAVRYGSRHIDVVLRARRDGIIDDIDAYELLDVQPSNFGRLGETVEERRITYGWKP